MKNLFKKSDFQGIYFGNYRLLFEKYRGADFSKICLVFPPQGTAFEEMFKKEYQEIKLIRDSFEKADYFFRNILKSKISDYILYPEAVKKEETPIVRNLALLVLEISLFEIVSKAKKIGILTAHSFGEYPMLVSAGVISFEDMLDIVFQREKIAAESPQVGKMIAVFEKKEKIARILKGIDFYFSNFNSQKQTVISFQNKAEEKITAVLEKNDVKFAFLKINQPYHNPLAKIVRSKMNKYLESKKINLKPPKLPFFSSVLKEKISSENFKKENIISILRNQITKKVDFVRQIGQIYNSGYYSFLELGPKAVCSEFIKNILAGREFKIFNLNYFLRKEKSKKAVILSGENNKIFSVISKIISKFTGYKIGNISIEDKFQEDLGIDSLKRAEIVFRTMDKLKIEDEEINSFKFKSVGDLVSYLSQPKKSPTKKEKKEVFKRYRPIWRKKEIEKFLEAENQKTEKQNKSIFFVNLGEIEKLKTNELAVFLTEKRGSIVAFLEESNFDFLKTVRKIQELLKNQVISKRKFNLALISRQPINPYIFGLAAFFKSLSKERGNFYFKHIHFEKKLPRENLNFLLAKEFQSPTDIEIFYKKGGRYISELTEIKGKNPLKMKNENILAIGGAKGITFYLIKELFKNSTIYIVGRSQRETVKKNIDFLKKNNDVYYYSADATNYQSLEKIFKKVSRKSKIDIVINGAGVQISRNLIDKSEEEISKELSKLRVAENVLKLSSKHKIKQIINFSSIVSRYGNPGQTIYSYVNEAINQLTNRYGYCSLNWPAWENKGMTKNPAIQQVLKEAGLGFIEEKQARNLFKKDLGSKGIIFYFNKKEKRKYDFTLKDYKRFKDILGTFKRDYFEISFSLDKNPCLEDHRIGNKIYLPAAFPVVSFFCLSHLEKASVPIISDFKVVNPLIVKNNLDLILKSENNKIEFKDRQKIYFKGSYKKYAKANSNSIPENLNPGKIGKKISLKSVYNRDNLFHGKKFQFLHEVYLNKENLITAKIYISNLSKFFDSKFYNLLFQLVDSGFQSLGLYGLLKNFVSIPVKFSNLYFFDNNFSDFVYIAPRLRKIDKDFLAGDVSILNKNGEVVLFMENVRMNKIKTTDRKLKFAL